MKPALFWVGLLVMLGSVLACGTQSNAEATAQVLSASLDLTATARSGSAETGDTALTAQAESTVQADALRLTQAALDVQAADAASATQTAVAPILAELQTYDIDPSEGELGWIHPPEEVAVEGYLQYGYINRFAGTIASDFVVAADIRWNTQSGVSGCGFVIRSNGNEDALSQYLVVATRAANGAVLFLTQQDGQTTSQENVDANGIDPQFEWQNDTTNRVAVVGRGDLLTVYTNGTQVAQFTADEYDRGFIAMVAVSESGRTVCRFENTWMWLLN